MAYIVSSTPVIFLDKKYNWLKNSPPIAIVIERDKTVPINNIKGSLKAINVCKIKKIGVDCRVQSAIDIDKIAEPYIRHRAIRHLEKGRVVIFAAGTGNPFFTTDTAAALRASEIDADAMLMAKNGVDGVYNDDPRTNPNAKKYDKISYDDIIINGLKVMDLSSCALCKQNNIPITVFDFNLENSLIKILNDEEVGTLVTK